MLHQHQVTPLLTLRYLQYLCELTHKLIPAASEATVLKIPLFTESCAAGFPSPAADYTEPELDLNEYCISRRHATYFVRAIGNSMTDIGLYSGDLMVVDKAEQPLHGYCYRGN